jgi:hypothetical protein
MDSGINRGYDTSVLRSKEAVLTRCRIAATTCVEQHFEPLSEASMHYTNIAASHFSVTTVADRVAVREQLERVLANPLFRNSKRYPALLSYVVEETLHGRAENLKERSLGIDVFKRDPSYDTNADTVVRVTAGEIRKRLAQYYYEPGHNVEIRIELPSGSYVPEFRIPETARFSSPELVQSTTPAPERSETLVAFPPAPATVTPSAPPERSVKAGLYWRWVFWGGAVAVLIGVLTSVAVRRNRSGQQVMEQFWGPTLNSPGAALLCLGDRASWDNERASLGTADANSKNLTVGDYIQNEDHVVMTDVLALNRVASMLQSFGKGYRIKNASTTTLADLRDGPVVLIGGINNEWTVRLTAPLRFSFALDADGGRIVDRQNSSPGRWSVPLSTPYLRLSKDYGIIARLTDPTTDQPVIIAAGLAAQGTVAAGEMLSNQEYLRGILQQAPKNWRNMNMEAVIATEVIEGKSGPPHVVAAYFW